MAKDKKKGTTTPQDIKDLVAHVRRNSAKGRHKLGKEKKNA